MEVGRFYVDENKYLSLRLAQICNNLANAKDYMVKDGKCYYKNKQIGTIKVVYNTVDNIINEDIQYKPIVPVKIVSYTGTFKFG